MDNTGRPFADERDDDDRDGRAAEEWEHLAQSASQLAVRLDEHIVRLTTNTAMSDDPASSAERLGPWPFALFIALVGAPALQSFLGPASFVVAFLAAAVGWVVVLAWGSRRPRALQLAATRLQVARLNEQIARVEARTFAVQRGSRREDDDTSLLGRSRQTKGWGDDD